MPTAGDPQATWDRLEDQLAWYDRRSTSAQRMFKRTKVAELVVAALVPVLAATEAPAAVTAGFAAVIVVLEAVQHLNQWQTTWVTYRSTAESLKHERYLYLAAAGPYAGSDRAKVLAERLEGLISQEHASWTASNRDRGRPGQAKEPG